MLRRRRDPPGELARIVRVQMIARIEGRKDAAGIRRVGENSVEVDDIDIRDPTRAKRRVQRLLGRFGEDSSTRVALMLRLISWQSWAAASPARSTRLGQSCPPVA